MPQPNDVLINGTRISNTRVAVVDPWGYYNKEGESVCVRCLETSGSKILGATELSKRRGLILEGISTVSVRPGFTRQIMSLRQLATRNILGLCIGRERRGEA